MPTYPLLSKFLAKTAKKKGTPPFAITIANTGDLSKCSASWNKYVVVEGPDGSQHLPPLVHQLDWDNQFEILDSIASVYDEVADSLATDKKLGYRYYGKPGAGTLRSQITGLLSQTRTALDRATLAKQPFEHRVVEVRRNTQADDPYTSFLFSFTWPLDETGRATLTKLNTEIDMTDLSWNEQLDMPQRAVDEFLNWAIPQTYTMYVHYPTSTSIPIDYGQWQQYTPLVTSEESAIRDAAKSEVLSHLRTALQKLRCAQARAAWGVVRPKRKALGGSPGLTDTVAGDTGLRSFDCVKFCFDQMEVWSETHDKSSTASYYLYCLKNFCTPVKPEIAVPPSSPQPGRKALRRFWT